MDHVRNRPDLEVEFVPGAVRAVGHDHPVWRLDAAGHGQRPGGPGGVGD